MTVIEAIRRTDELYPNVIPFSQKAYLLEQLDNRVFNEILVKYDDIDCSFESGYQENQDAQLVIKAPFEEIYIKYLVMQLDIINSDITRYQNSYALFNTMYLDYIRYINRNHTIKACRISID